MSNDLATIGAVIGEPTRASMLALLSDGRAYPAGQLARATSTKPQTASFHLDKLVEAGLIVRLTQGRHVYYALAGEPVAQALEALAVIAPSPEPLVDGVWRGPEALRYARTCYGHLAGKAGVALLDALLRRGYLADNGSDYAVTAEGGTWLDELGVHRPKLKRPLTRRCLDWSERRPHLAGSLGVALTTRLIELEWLARKRDTRAIRMTPLGRDALERQLGVHLDA